MDQHTVKGNMRSGRRTDGVEDEKFWEVWDKRVVAIPKSGVTGIIKSDAPKL